MRQTSAELWQGQQRAVFVEAGASAIFFSRKFPLQNSGGQHRGCGAALGTGSSYRGAAPPAPHNIPGCTGGWGGRIEGNTGWNYLSISFSSLFFPTGCSWSCIFEVCCCQVAQKSRSQAVPAPSTHHLPHPCVAPPDRSHLFTSERGTRAPSLALLELS